MTWTLLVYLLGLILQTGLVARSMYGLLCLSDLEQDFINPYDLSKKLNGFVKLEYGVQLLLTTVLVLGGRWVIGLMHVGLSAYMVWLYMQRLVYIDAADVFKQLKRIKRRRTIVFGAYAVSMVLIVYMLIHTFVHSVLSPSGRETARQLFRDAGTSLHGY